MLLRNNHWVLKWTLEKLWIVIHITSPEAFLFGGGIEIAVWFWRDAQKNGIFNQSN